MVYIVFNILLTISLIVFTVQVNKKIKDQTITIPSLPAAMLFNDLSSCVFTLILVVKEFGYETFVSTMMRFVFLGEGVAFVILCFAFIEMGSKKEFKLANLFKFLLIGFIFYIVFFKIRIIKLSPDYGFTIKSDSVFHGFFKYIIPLDWFQFYNIFTKFVLPIVGFLFLILLQEHNNAPQLEKFQASIIASAFVLMWIIFITVNFVSTEALLVAYLYMFANLLFNGFANCDWWNYQLLHKCR